MRYIAFLVLVIEPDYLAFSTFSFEMIIIKKKNFWNVNFSDNWQVASLVTVTKKIGILFASFKFFNFSKLFTPEGWEKRWSSEPERPMYKVRALNTHPLRTVMQRENVNAQMKGNAPCSFENVYVFYVHWKHF